MTVVAKAKAPTSSRSWSLRRIRAIAGVAARLDHFFDCRCRTRRGPSTRPCSRPRFTGSPVHLLRMVYPISPRVCRTQLPAADDQQRHLFGTSIGPRSPCRCARMRALEAALDDPRDTWGFRPDRPFGRITTQIAQSSRACWWVRWCRCSVDAVSAMALVALAVVQLLLHGGLSCGGGLTLSPSRAFARLLHRPGRSARSPRW